MGIRHERMNEFQVLIIISTNRCRDILSKRGRITQAGLVLAQSTLMLSLCDTRASSELEGGHER